MILGITEINHDRLDMTYSQLLDDPAKDSELTDMQISIRFRWESGIDHSLCKLHVLIFQSTLDLRVLSNPMKLGQESFLENPGGHSRC